MSRDMISIKNLGDLADRGIWLIRDAAQSVPALGRKGANEAVIDTIDLAEHLANGSMMTKNGSLKEMYHEWSEIMDECEKSF